MTQYVVIGTSAFMDTTVASGPFRSPERAREVAEELTAKGWNTETCELLPPYWQPNVTNEEGAE
jgi:hypothetical protein